MILRLSLPQLFVCALISLGLAAGCGKDEPSKPDNKSAPAKQAATDDHGDGSGARAHEADPHDVVITEADVKKPADFKDAVARIKEYRKDIEVKAGSDVPGKAHRQLDELEIVLKWLPGIARDSNVPKNQWETINTTAQQLRELFEKVHQNIDNKKNPDFAAVAKDVDAAIGRLEAAAEAKVKP
jgi:hypothetical protein